VKIAQVVDVLFRMMLLDIPSRSGRRGILVPEALPGSIDR
jgi:hypothetical protein